MEAIAALLFVVVLFMVLGSSPPTPTPIEPEVAAAPETPEVSRAAVSLVADEVEPEAEVEVEVEAEAVVEAVKVEPEWPEAVPSPELSAQERRDIVFQSLDVAWSQGHRTYAALMAAVREQSGENCNRHQVAKWKKERGLVGNGQEVAA